MQKLLNVAIETEPWKYSNCLLKVKLLETNQIVFMHQISTYDMAKLVIRYAIYYLSINDVMLRITFFQQVEMEL